jgi:hypothetical protein
MQKHDKDAAYDWMRILADPAGIGSGSTPKDSP